MKVLFVGSHLDKGGGQALQTLQLFQELRSRVDGEYLCLRSVGMHRDLLERNDVRIVGSLRYPQGILDLRTAILAERGDWDLVQVFDFYFGLPAAYLGRAFPRAVLFGTDPIAEVGWRFGAPARAAAQLGLPGILKGTELVVNSLVLANRFQRFSPVFIPNGLDLQRFERLPSRGVARRLLGLDANTPLLVWVGKVVPIKRVEWILEILRELPEAHLVAVGGYSEEHYGDQYYRALRSRYSDVMARATFPGEVALPQVDQYLAAGDVFVFPSLFEGMPNAVMEAMAAALPVVVSDIPAHRAILRQGDTGFLARDPPEFAAMVSALIDNPELRDQVGRRAREAALAEFGFDRVCDRYLELYRRMVMGTGA
jgi:glycosyltransferase involved in cell wall biosynthesis